MRIIAQIIQTVFFRGDSKTSNNETMCRKNSLRQKRKKILINWLDDEDSPRNFCPAKPGDEIIFLGTGNIFHEALDRQKPHLIFELLKNGLSPEIPPVFHLSDTTPYDHPRYSEAPLIKWMDDDNVDFFSAFMLSKKSRRWPLRPQTNLDLLTYLTYLEAIECFKYFLENPQKSTKTHSGVSLLSTVCRYVSNENISLFLNALEKNISYSEEFIDDAKKNADILNCLISRHKNNGVLYFFQKKYPVHLIKDLKRHPLCIATIFSNANIVQWFLEDISWENCHEIGQMIVEINEQFPQQIGGTSEKIIQSFSFYKKTKETRAFLKNNLLNGHYGGRQTSKSQL